MADAHPFSFIIDLSSECARLDPDGEYIRRWLPALALLPTEYIHQPWAAPQEVSGYLGGNHFFCTRDAAKSKVCIQAKPRWF